MTRYLLDWRTPAGLAGRKRGRSAAAVGIEPGWMESLSGASMIEHRWLGKALAQSAAKSLDI